MTIRYGTGECERIIRRTPPGQRVAFALDHADDGTETLFALHPVTREIRTRRGGADSWREAHFIPAGAAYVGRCGRVSEVAGVTFVA